MAKFCPECGVAAAGGKFCSECGFRFTELDNSSDASTFVQSPATHPPAAAASSPATYAPPPPLGSQGPNAVWQPTPGNVAATAAAIAPAVNRVASYATPNAASYTTPNAATYAKTPYQYQPQANQSSWSQPPRPVQQSSFARPSGGAVTVPSAASSSSRSAGVPMATPVTVPPTGVADPYKPMYPTAVPATTMEPVPPAATGVDAQHVYEKCVQTIRASRGGNNEDGVKAFKKNCQLYGLKQIDVDPFYESLVRELGPEATLAFVPELARLVPDDDRRKELIEFNASKRLAITKSAGVGLGNMQSPQATYTGANAASFASRDSVSSVGSYRERSSSNPQQPASKGILKGRYADHPNCDICNVVFDVTKRRHSCRHCGLFVCSSCSPLHLLIPPGQQIAGAKGYEPSMPQRVCIQCAPQLHQYQEELVARYAKANEDNVYEARSRLVHVPFSNSLFKECQNAADIIGNFFRDDWGAAADRAIPVSFLQKAHGLAIMTIIKAGFLVTGQIGSGLVVAKLPDGSWSAPSAIGIGGLGGGFEIGGEIIQLMIILGSEGAVRVFHKPQANVGAGLDLAVGPYGRSAVAAAAVSASGLNANYSYSHSKGLYAGISLQGSVIMPRNDLNRKFYGRDLQPSEILMGHIATPNAARPLYEAIGRAMEGAETHRETVARRASIMGPCRLCNCPMFLAHTHQIWNKNCKTCKHVH